MTGAAIILCDGEGRILFANRGAEDIFETRDLPGRAFSEFLTERSLRPAGDEEDGSLCESVFRASEYSRQKELIVSKSPLDRGPGAGTAYVVLDITRCREMEEERAKNRNLIEVGKFAAHLAHEIKNPITGIRGVMEMMSGVHKQGDPRFEIFQEAFLQINRLDCLVKDLLSFSKQLRPNFEQARLKDILESAVSLAWIVNRNKKIKLDADYGNEKITVRADLLLLQQAFVNIITNSIEAIEKEGNIAIKVSEFPGKIEVAVTDDGQGMSPHTLTSIFEPFFTTKSGGTGLGLPLVQRILQIHGATLKIISQENRGSTFTVTFVTG